MMAPVLSDVAVVLATSLAAALVFGGAALVKLRDPEHFIAQLEAYALLPAAWVPLVGRALPWVMLLAAAAIVSPSSRAPAAVVLMGLNLVFVTAIGVNLARGHDRIDCGCSLGAGNDRLSLAMLLRNAWLTLLILPAVLAPSYRALEAADVPSVLAGALALAGLYVLIDVLLHNHELLLGTGRPSFLSSSSSVSRSTK